MECLGNYSDDESEEKSETSEPQKELPSIIQSDLKRNLVSQWIGAVESDSETDQDEINQGGSSASLSKSIDSPHLLFEAIEKIDKPSFLSSKVEEFQLAEKKSTFQDVSMESKNNLKSSQTKINSKSIPSTQPRISFEDFQRNQQSQKPASKTTAKKSEDTVKDRTKRQRLSGQSGIGEDFRVWRSDEEMRLRQQFDA